MNKVRVNTGPGYFVIEDWKELWHYMWRAVAHTIYMDTEGRCSCGCEDPVCEYCVYEC